MNGSYLPAARARLATAFPVLLAMLVWMAIPPAPVAADSALQARIEYQVQREPRLEGTEVRVITDTGNIVLTGQVPLLAQKMLYEQIAWQTRGALDVDSEIRVVPQSRVSDRQLEEAILGLIRNHDKLAGLDVGVKDGVVIVHGTFTNASEVLSLKWRIAEIQGVVNILIDSQVLARAPLPGD